MADANSQRRGWFSFRLRTLLIVFGIIAAPLGLIVNERHQSNYELRLANDLRLLGVREIAIDIPYGAVEPQQQSKSRNWWRRLEAATLGERIYCIWGQGSDCTDLSKFARLTRLQLLDLSRSSVSELAPLASVDTLEVVRLNDTDVRDVAPLAALNHLRVLSLFGTPVADVASLASLPSLEDLNLYYTQVDDVSPLVGVKSLKSLELNKSLVKREDVEAFQRIRPDCNTWRFVAN